jgi:hypothetical protein
LGQNTRNEKRMNRILEAADPNKKGIITFSKFIILMEIYKKKEEQVIYIRADIHHWKMAVKAGENKVFTW